MAQLVTAAPCMFYTNYCMIEHNWICKYCNSEFTTRALLRSHIKSCDKKNHIKYDWTCRVCNKHFDSRRQLCDHRKITSHSLQGINIKVDVACQYCGYKTTTKSGLKNHEKFCICNPNRIANNQNFHHWTEEERKEISERMKKLHSEGKAFSWADLSKRREPSYPEKWFIKVLKNEFDFIEGKDYEREKKFYTFSLDFVFPNKKVIEIDGSQHKRSDYQKDCDKRKDQKLKEDGWLELRLDWNYCFNNSKEAIQKVKEFLG